MEQQGESIDLFAAFQKASGMAASSDRDAYLEEVGSRNSRLADELRELLVCQDRSKWKEARQRKLKGEQLVTWHISDPAGSGMPLKFADYRLLKLTDEGGYGRVYLAERVASPDDLVAIKICKTAGNDENSLLRFERECRALARLQHENIGRLIEAGTTSDIPFYSMEFIDGPPITQYCREQEAGRADRARLFLGVCRGVLHAHEDGIIHRDIKPANVLVARDGTAKLIDFGIAKSLAGGSAGNHRLTRSMQFIGSPAYASPEQVHAGQDADIRSDVYALGILLHELLSGGPEGLACGEATSDLAKIRNAVLRRRLSPVDMPGSTIDRIIQKATERRPGDRYQSVAELAHDLQAWVEGRAVCVERTPLARRVGNWVSANPRRSARAFMAAVVVLSFCVMSIVWGRRADVAQQAVTESLQKVAGVEKVAEIAQAQARIAQQAVEDEAKLTAAVNEFLCTTVIGRMGQRTPQSLRKTRRDQLLDAVRDVGPRFARYPELESRVRTALGYALWDYSEHATAYEQFKIAFQQQLSLARSTSQTATSSCMGVIQVGLALKKYDEVQEYASSFVDRMRGRRTELHELLHAQAAIVAAFRGRGEFEEALEHCTAVYDEYKSVAETDGDVYWLRLLLAACYHDAGRFDEACSAYDDLRSDCKRLEVADSAVIQDTVDLTLARHLVDRASFDAAHDVLREMGTRHQSLTSNVTTESASYFIVNGTLASREGRFDEAVQHYLQGIYLEQQLQAPYVYNSWNFLARTIRSQGDFDLAMRIARVCLFENRGTQVVDSERIAIQHTIASIHRFQGQYFQESYWQLKLWWTRCQFLGIGRPETVANVHDAIRAITRSWGVLLALRSGLVSNDNLHGLVQLLFCAPNDDAQVPLAVYDVAAEEYRIRWHAAGAGLPRPGVMFEIDAD